MDQYYSLTATEGSFGGADLRLDSSIPRLGPDAPVTEAPISPGEAPEPVHYSVTVVATVLVGILFLLVYLQLIMVICFGYKLLTYQTVLLFDILLWATLRLTLYSFYFYHCCEMVDKLDRTFPGWVLVSFPSWLQYFSLALLVHYFGENIFKVLKRRQEMATLAPPYRKMKKYKVFCEFLWVLAVLVFLLSSLAFHFFIDNSIDKVNSGLKTVLVIIRVVLLDGLFLVMGITLGVCIIIIYTTRAGKDVLETQGGWKCVPPFTSILLILIFASRDLYSIAAAISGTKSGTSISGYPLFVTVEGDYGFMTDMNSTKYGYIAFFAVLMVWEVIPTYIIVFFFRVRLPRYRNGLRLNLKPCKIRRKPPRTNQKHFFENPNRYDEHDQLLHPTVQRQSSISTHVSIPSLTGSGVATSNGYGSTNSAHRPPQSKHYSINAAHHHHGNSHPAHSSVMPGTTPPQLFTSPNSVFTDHDQ